MALFSFSVAFLFCLCAACGVDPLTILSRHTRDSTHDPLHPHRPSGRRQPANRSDTYCIFTRSITPSRLGFTHSLFNLAAILTSPSTGKTNRILHGILHVRLCLLSCFVHWIGVIKSKTRRLCLLPLICSLLLDLKDLFEA